MLKLKNSAMLVVAVLCGYLALMTPDWKSDLVAASGVAYLNDQNGDGKADVLLQSTSTGDFSLALLNGLTVLNITSVGALADSGMPVLSTGDFNGDGNADILTRDVGGSFFPGAFRVELTDSTGNVFDGGFMATMSTDLNDQVMSTKDYNFDGKADVLLRNSSTGVWTMNYMNGTSDPVIGTLSGVTTNLCYTFKSDGDYDGNLVPDILLRKDACGGGTYPWLVYTMKGDFNYYQTGVPPIVQSPAYSMLDGDHDWNGDGRDDVAFRLNSGTTRTWAVYWMNGAGATSGSTTLPGVAVQYVWDLAALADFNGDGTTDLLLREIDTGQWYTYTENSAGGVIAGGVIAGMNPYMNLSWQLQTVDDFNGDGRRDVLLRNTSTGAWQANLFGSTGLTVTSGALAGMTTDLTYVIQND